MLISTSSLELGVVKFIMQASEGVFLLLGAHLFIYIALRRVFGLLKLILQLFNLDNVSLHFSFFCQNLFSVRIDIALIKVPGDEASWVAVFDFMDH